MTSGCSSWSRIAGAIVLAACSGAFAQDGAGAPADDDSGRDTRSIADRASPAAGAKAPRRMSGLVRPRFPTNTRAGWIPGWPRIPALPQVKAKVPITNRVVSRAEAEREEAERTAADSRPATQPDQAATQPDGSPVSEGQAERLRRLGDAGRAIAADDERRRRELDRFVREAERDERSGDECGLGEGHAIDSQPGANPDTRLLADSEQLTTRQRADRLLAAGEIESAADEYLIALAENPGDADSARALAVALLVADKPEQAGKAAVEAYRLDLALTGRSYDPSSLPEGISSRSLISRLVKIAGRTKSPGTWLLAASLAQAEGRPDVAARFVERARSAGLAGPIADAFVVSLAKEVHDARAGGS